MTALAGSIEVFPLPEVFVLLSRSGVTGALLLSRDSRDASVFFRRAKIYDAYSSLTNRRRVGDFTPEELDTFVREQIRDAIFDVLQWDTGRFTFEEGESSDTDVGVQMPVENLLMEASRQLKAGLLDVATEVISGPPKDRPPAKPADPSVTAELLTRLRAGVETL